MKMNWGTGIVIAFIGFIAFIMFFVITMSTNKKYEHDLVTEDYYKEELEYQN
ncbi:MAG: FixH family protein, partial [Flavobacteriaceae bacterium]|nr:FixH family protein [Flavobacteriaceae bacterium]